MCAAALVALGGCHDSAPAPPATAATATAGQRQVLPRRKETATAEVSAKVESPAVTPPAATPAGAAAARASVFNPVRPGEGSATELVTNRPAILHCDGKDVPLPATLWFDQSVAPEGESPFTFRSQANGVYVVSFAGSTTCTFTDRAGQPLAPVDIQYQLVMDESGPTKTVLKLSLAAQPGSTARPGD
jgi:hypothetical protein